MRKFRLILFILSATLQLTAQITYDAGSNTITIEGFPPEMPCSLNTLFMTDQMNGWNKIERKDNIFRINANIMLGHPAGTDSCLQIAGNQNEIVHLNGNLIASPFFVKGINKKLFWETYKAKNFLILGNEKRPGVSGRLIVGKGKNLYIGILPEQRGKYQTGGGLICHNSKITASGKSKFGEKFVWFYFNSKVVLKNSGISRFKGSIYGFTGKRMTIDGSVFSGGGGIISGISKFSNCTFKNLNIAIIDYGKLDAVFNNCVFENNKRNWRMRYFYGITCIDCKISKPKLPDIYQATTRKGKTAYPRFISQRHIIVKVVDKSGNPVENAVVTATPVIAGKKLISNNGIKTGKDGMTPGKGSSSALLLTEKMIMATKQRTPETTIYSYKITAEKNGEKVDMNNFKPVESWQVITLKL